MRRKDREVTDSKRIAEIMSKCYCCRLAFSDENAPYIVPMNFGYEKNGEQIVLYFHSAKEGRKIDLIELGNAVGFEMDTDHVLNEAENACGFSSRFQSIIGTGKITLLTERADKEHALKQIMYHYTGKKEWDFSEKMLDAVAVFELVVNELSCKEHQ